MKTNFSSDPEQFGKTAERGNGKRKLVLGLDLGTNCGAAYALWRPGDEFTVKAEHIGQWDLSAGSYDSGAIRFVRLRRFLEHLKPDLVAAELVRYTPAEKLTKYNAGAIMARAATSCELFGAFRSTVAMWAEENGVPFTHFTIGEIKKRATGKGNANKEDMIKACNHMFGTSFAWDDYTSTGADNAADSAFVALLALEQYAPGLTFEKES